MKQLLRSFFKPLLSLFERGDKPYQYKPLNRKILIVMGLLFCGLASGVFFVFLFYSDRQLTFLFPSIIFGVLGFICIIIGTLGNERAVSTIWGNH